MKHLTSIRLVACSLVLLTSVAFGKDNSVRSLTTPTGWWYYNGQSAQGVTNLINNLGARLVSIEVEQTSPLRFTVTLVKNTGAYASGWWWYSGQTGASLSNLLAQNNARLIDLEPYNDGGQLRFAAIMVPNTGPAAKAWWWYYGQTSTQLLNIANTNKARIVDIERYTVNGTTRYGAIMIANQGADASGWWFWVGQTFSGVSQKLDELNARLIDLDEYVVNGQRRYLTVMVPNTGSNKINWWWYSGLTAQGVLSATDQNGARVVDVQPYFSNGEKRFTVIMVNNSNAQTTRLGSILGFGSCGVTGAYVKEVAGPTIASLNRQFVFEPASTVKALHHTHAMIQIDSQSSSFDDEIPWCPDPILNSDGSASSCPQTSCPFETIALDSALEEMMQDSDNRTTDAVGRWFGVANINATAQALGMPNTQLNHTLGCGGPVSNELTLTDIGRLYEQVATGLLSAESREDFYSLMAGRDYDFSGVWGSLNTIITQEAQALGVTTARRNQFASKIKLSYKAGGYTLNCNPTCLEYRSLGGWISMPACEGGNEVEREYVYGFFIEGCSSKSSADSRFAAVRAELVREQIRDALATYADPDSCIGSEEPTFIRADANSDTAIDLSDAIFILNFLFTGGDAPQCDDAADANDDGILDMSDAVKIMGVGFLGDTLPIGTRFGEFQSDPTSDPLGCQGQSPQPLPPPQVLPLPVVPIITLPVLPIPRF
jgi:hypothetical protein